jgi:hypothetical protein
LSAGAPSSLWLLVALRHIVLHTMSNTTHAQPAHDTATCASARCTCTSRMHHILLCRCSYAGRLAASWRRASVVLVETAALA